MKKKCDRNLNNCVHRDLFQKRSKKSILSFMLIPLIGFLAFIWVLIRIIPKPSRAQYPCIRVAFPLASAFVSYVGGLMISLLGFRSAQKWFSKAKYLWGIVAAFITIAGMVLLFQGSPVPLQAKFNTSIHPPNQPIGQAQGIFPGRVVWVHNPDATREDCVPGAYGHGWFLNENNNQEAIDSMLSQALRAVSEEETNQLAWDAIFRFHNQEQGLGNIGYQSNEKIFIKINATSSWSGNINPSDLSKIFNQYYGISETSPQLVLSVLRQLVNIAGVPQQNIYVGDPMRHIYKHCYDLWHPEFPNVHYLDHDGWGGREPVVPSQTAKIYYSDRGAILRTGGLTGNPVTEDYFYTVFEEVDYLINIPTLKGHKHAGITAFPKNHFGSHTRNGATHLHGGLVAPDASNPSREEYGLYRVQVDLMAHYLLGKKNLLYLLDGLWTSDYEIDEPDKWWMMPFNNDWMSSIFLSLDPVAIESVGFDFLRSEFTVQRGLATYPQMGAVDDYLHQAADSANWPDSLIYDPENDGTAISSLGVHEHWNDSLSMQYSRNLGTGEGIELVKVSPPTGLMGDDGDPLVISGFKLNQNFPNPFNSTTEISYEIFKPARIEGVLFNLSGQKVMEHGSVNRSSGLYSFHWDGTFSNGQDAPSGIYLYRLTASGNKRQEQQSIRMILIR